MGDEEEAYNDDGVCGDIKDCCSQPAVCPCCTCFWIVASLIVAIVCIATSLETIDSTNYGIQYDSYQAVLKNEVREEGLHTKPTFGTFILWPKTHQTLKQVVPCMSSDGVYVTPTVAFQFTPDNKHLYDLTLKYKDFKTYQNILKLISRSGIRNACSQFSAQEYQTKRAAVQQSMFEKVKARLAQGKMYALVIELQVTNILRPVKYESAVDAKEAAKNEIARIKNLRTQLITQANTKLMKVKVAANKTIDTAKTSAAIITKNAEADAAIVLGRYKAQGALYKQVRTTRGLTSEGLLAYIGTRLVDELNAITVGIPAPARVQYMSNVTSTRL